MLDLPDAEAALLALAGDLPSCGSCWWLKGGRDGAPFLDGTGSGWMDARCQWRFLDLMLDEFERDPADREMFTSDHLERGGCGSRTVLAQQLRLDLPPQRIPLDRALHDRWWQTHYPRLPRRVEQPLPACARWRSRRDPPDVELDLVAAERG